MSVEWGKLKATPSTLQNQPEGNDYFRHLFRELTMTRIREYVSLRSGGSGNFHDGMRMRSALNAYWKSIWKARAALCPLLIFLWMTVPCINFPQVQAPRL